jgi:hypothetical protein
VFLCAFRALGAVVLCELFFAPCNQRSGRAEGGSVALILPREASQVNATLRVESIQLWPFDCIPDRDGEKFLFSGVQIFRLVLLRKLVLPLGWHLYHLQRDHSRPKNSLKTPIINATSSSRLRVFRLHALFIIRELSTERGSIESTRLRPRLVGVDAKFFFSSIRLVYYSDLQILRFSL